MNISKILLIFCILFVSFFVLSGCMQEKPSNKTDVTPEESPVETVSFSEGAALMKSIFSENGIDLDSFFTVKMLMAISENSLNTIKTKLNELKASFVSQNLKDLADVYLMLVDEFNARKALAVQSKIVSDIEELSTAKQCEQLAEFDLLVEKTQARINSYNLVNQKMQNFVKNYAKEASEIGLDKLVDARLADKKNIFNGFAQIKESVDVLKNVCKEGIEEEVLSPGDKGYIEEETEDELEEIIGEE